MFYLSNKIRLPITPLWFRCTHKTLRDTIICLYWLNSRSYPHTLPHSSYYSEDLCMTDHDNNGINGFLSVCYPHIEIMLQRAPQYPQSCPWEQERVLKGTTDIAGLNMNNIHRAVSNDIGIRMYPE